LRGIDWPGEPVVDHEDIHRSQEAPGKKKGQPQQHDNNDGTAIHSLNYCTLHNTLAHPE
jgi:hypothetical protein